MNILDQLAGYARERVAASEKKISRTEIRRIAESLPGTDFKFEKALSGEELSFICECKKASPSKGIIAENFPYLDIARDYERAGADCISVLTEPKWFLGSDEYLRKDFTVDDYMIYEAKALGASAVLLICSILSEEQIHEYIGICDSLGFSALVEAHNAEEIETALRAGARIVGVNNRNLKDFTVDTSNSRRMRELVPDDVLFVSESGVKDVNDIRLIRESGADAVLVGEALMRSADKATLLNEWRKTE